MESISALTQRTRIPVPKGIRATSKAHSLGATRNLAANTLPGPNVAELLSAQGALQKKIAQLTFADALTGVKNRAALLISLQRAIDKSQDLQSYAAVLLVDIDDFKSHNVHLGHLAGDSLLQQSARRISLALGPDVAVARLFADKFVVVLEDLGPICETAAAKAQQMATCVSNCFSNAFETDGANVYLSVSMGLCLIGPQDCISTDVLIDRAELVTDNAKEAGGNCLFSFEFGALDYAASSSFDFAGALPPG